MIWLTISIVISLNPILEFLVLVATFSELLELPL